MRMPPEFIERAFAQNAPLAKGGDAVTDAGQTV